MHVLITGGAGNLGRSITDEMIAHGHEVTLFDRVEPGSAAVPWRNELPFVRGELTSADDRGRAFEAARPRAVRHVGAIPYATDQPDSVNPEILEYETWRTNVLGSYYVLDTADGQAASK